MKLLKYTTFGFIIVIVFHLLLSNIIVYAHSGNTDSNGGHYNRSTGRYHYHHGYPAHQHADGKCPYTYQDEIEENEDNDNEIFYFSPKIEDNHNSSSSYSSGSANNYSNNNSYSSDSTNNTKESSSGISQFLLYIVTGIFIYINKEVNYA